MLPLDGLTVLALEQAVSAPLATRQLADLGARVIKFERPGGGDFARGYDHAVNGLSSYFVWLNRGKLSLTLDLKHPVAHEVLPRLLDEADVLVQNLAPGALARLGLTPERLAAEYPRLIVCSISGYGSGGPFASRKAYDLLIQCEAGLLSVTGTPASPAKVGISIADIAAGSYAFSGILTALYARERSGHGAVFEVAMLDALGEWMSAPAYYTAFSGSPPARTGARHATIAPYGPFTCRDETDIFVAVQNDREWARFCVDVLRLPELADDPRFADNVSRVAQRDALDTTIGAVMGTLSAAEATARLDRAGIANARLNSLEDFWNHPQLAQRNRWRSVNSPVGPLRMLLPPVAIGPDEASMGPVPDVGEHTTMLLGALGYTSERLDALRAEGAI